MDVKFMNGVRERLNKSPERETLVIIHFASRIELMEVRRYLMNKYLKEIPPGSSDPKHPLAVNTHLSIGQIDDLVRYRCYGHIYVVGGKE
ncbi:MAG: hypothetical protein KJ600_05995 [Nanoarchaeota archaeon]|nr:hypothetical protein [Nanoarchaeota archaeon]MBU1104079.1 hypothetical protein [Nanoarchaeota archaeon]